MPKLVTPDGEVAGEDVESRFAAAMAAPEPDEPPAAAPPRHDAAEGQEAPAAAAAPADPKHAKTRTRAGGRGRATGRAAGGKRGKAAAAAPAEGAYVAPVTELLNSVTLVAALVPMPSPTLGARVRLQGALVDQHTPSLAQAIDLAARNNQVIRRGVESLTQGSAGWVLPAVMGLAPFAMASAALWRQPVTEDHVAAANAFAEHVHQQLRGDAHEDQEDLRESAAA